MFSYAGRKWKFIKLYPKPKFNRIVEPFAGTLSYSYMYWENEVWAMEKYEKVYRVWKYLQQASPKDILALPIPERGAPVVTPSTQWMCPEERWLLGFSCNNATASPRNIAGRMGFNSWERDRLRIAKDLHKIRHWKILYGDYSSFVFDHEETTWFIDPPYQNVPPTMGYVHGNKELDYKELARWCKARKGQIIVCENTDADWLPVRALTELSGQRRKTHEAIWYKETD